MCWDCWTNTRRNRNLLTTFQTDCADLHQVNTETETNLAYIHVHAGSLNASISQRVTGIDDSLVISLFHIGFLTLFQCFNRMDIHFTSSARLLDKDQTQHPNQEQPSPFPMSRELVKRSSEYVLRRESMFTSAPAEQSGPFWTESDHTQTQMI